MWSGWGIRTLSTQNPAFNPYNYQTGSVWPHDNGMIALGFKRYGFGAEAARIARDISEAGTHFLLNRLPELYTAPQRDESTFPVQYLGANVPQAWAAGSVFSLMQAMLGFLPDAPHDKLYIRRPGCPISPYSTFVWASMCSTSVSGAMATRRNSRCYAAIRKWWSVPASSHKANS